MNRNRISVAVQVIRTIVRAGQAAGADAEVALAQAGIAPQLLTDPDARVPLAAEEALWEAFARESGDPLFGLHAAQTIQPGDFDVLDYAIRSSTSLGAALDNLCRYNRLIHDVAEINIVHTGEDAILTHRFRHLPTGASLHAADFSLAAIVEMGRQLTGRDWAPRRVRFQHDLSTNVEAYQAVFNTDVVFAAESNQLVFDAAILEWPVQGGDSALNRILRQHADQLLDALPKHEDILDQVRRHISHVLPGGVPAMETIAFHLHMTPRTLQRRLKAHGISYQKLLENLRKDLAQSYLRERRLAISELAYLLGYSEPSAFQRAFKRWTGMTPDNFRRHET